MKQQPTRTSLTRIALSVITFTALLGGCDQIDEDTENNFGVAVSVDNANSEIAIIDLKKFHRNITIGPYTTKDICEDNKDADCWAECDKSPPKRPGETLVNAVAGKCKPQGTRPPKYYAKCTCYYTKPPCVPGDVGECDPIDPIDPIDPLSTSATMP